MTWEDVCRHYPHTWVLIEAIRAHSDSGKRILDEISVIKTFPDSVNAMHDYTELHQESPEREMYIFHSDREQLDISERMWIGIRGVP
jgi:hypothetical protein